MARIGLPQQQYLNQQNAINRNQAGALTTLSRSANPSAGLASIVRAGNDANNALNAQDAAARQQNQRFAIQQNAILGDQALAKQQYDKFDKYTENFNRAASLRGAADQNLNNAFNSAGQLAGGLYQAGQINNTGLTMGELHNNPVLPQAQSLGFGGSQYAPYQNPFLNYNFNG
jgi:hypothetical protein